MRIHALMAAITALSVALPAKAGQDPVESYPPPPPPPPVVQTVISPVAVTLLGDLVAPVPGGAEALGALQAAAPGSPQALAAISSIVSVLSIGLQSGTVSLPALSPAQAQQAAAALDRLSTELAAAGVDVAPLASLRAAMVASGAVSG